VNEALAAELLAIIRTGLHQAVKDRLGASYNNPLDKLLSGVVEAHDGELRELLVSGIRSALADGDFRTLIHDALREKLAKVLVQRFGGELEKQVNALKSDPATRARITLAIDDILRQGAAPC
jgi:hypothetical protein